MTSPTETEQIRLHTESEQIIYDFSEFTTINHTFSTKNTPPRRIRYAHLRIIRTLIRRRKNNIRRQQQKRRQRQRQQYKRQHPDCKNCKGSIDLITDKFVRFHDGECIIYLCGYCYY